MPPRPAPSTWSRTRPTSTALTPQNNNLVAGNPSDPTATTGNNSSGRRFVVAADGTRRLQPREGFEAFIDWAREVLHADVATRHDLDCGEKFVPAAAREIAFRDPATATQVITDFLPACHALATAFHSDRVTDFNSVTAERVDVVDDGFFGQVVLERVYDMQRVFWGLIFDVLNRFRVIPAAITEATRVLTETLERLEDHLEVTPAEQDGGETARNSQHEDIFSIGGYCVEVLRWKREVSPVNADEVVAFMRSKRPPHVTDDEGEARCVNCAGALVQA